jgi:hypothetical protein
MLEYVLDRERDAESPEMTQVPEESSGVVHWRAGVRLIFLRARNESIGRALGVRTVGAVSTVDTYTALAFADSPLDWINDQSIDEVEENPRKVDVKGFLLFLCKFGIDVRKIAGYRRMVVILVASNQIERWAVKNAQQRDSLCHDAKTAWKIGWR